MTQEEFEAQMNEPFDPVPCDLQKEISESMKDPEFAEAWKNDETEFALLNAMLDAQKASKMTQAEHSSSSPPSVNA